jgi:hypothetical protein
MTTPADPRPRQYVITTRRCRQRLAQRLGAGACREQAARAERLTAYEVEALLAEDSFQALVAHYQALQALAPEARLDRLTALAIELLELALAAGDVRVAIFVVRESRAGRNPARRLAEHAIERLQRAVSRAAPPGRSAGRGGGPVPPRSEADFPYCAATCATNDAALALAGEATAACEAQVAATRDALAMKLTREAERDGTAGTDGDGAARQAEEAVVIGFTEEAFAAPARGLNAARKLADRWAAFRAGRPPPMAEPECPARPRTTDAPPLDTG